MRGLLMKIIMVLIKFLVLFLLVVVVVLIGGKRIKDRRYNDILQKDHPKIMLKMPAISSTKRYTGTVLPVAVDCKLQSFKDAIKMSKSKAKCKPRPSVVHLESATQSTLIPNAVIVKRCAGMCTASHKCIPIREHHTLHYVREIKNNQVSCTSVDVIEHLECKCDCPDKPTDCKNGLEDYDRDNCKCFCKESLKDQCMEKRRPYYYWNEESCKCLCKEMFCTTGTQWNPDYCRCVKQNETRSK